MALSIINIWSIPAANAETNTVTITKSSTITYSETSSDSLPVGLKKNKYNFKWAKFDCLRDLIGTYYVEGASESVAIRHASGVWSKPFKLKTTTKIADYYWGVDENGEDSVYFTITCKSTGKVKLTKTSNSYEFCFSGGACTFGYTKPFLAEYNWKVSIKRTFETQEVTRISPPPDPTLYDAETIEILKEGASFEG